MHQNNDTPFHRHGAPWYLLAAVTLTVATVFGDDEPFQVIQLYATVKF